MEETDDITERDFKEFFEWIFDKEITLDKELDLTLCSTQYEPYIYFPTNFKPFLQTKPMQRLKQVTHLGSVIKQNENAYHTRYAHCLGTYNNATVFYILQYRKLAWRKRIEEEGRKIEVLADIVESLRHDDGHNILSHGLEKIIGREYGAHEILGNRFKCELPETIDAINFIHPDLATNMQLVSSPSYPLITLREGNVDFDRLDFICRDSMYLGIDSERNLMNRLIRSCSIQTIIEDGKKKEAVVYDYEALKDIEKFLALRAKNYKDFYYSTEVAAMDTEQEAFCRKFLSLDEPYGSELKEYLQACVSNGAKHLDLNEFLQWNDIRYFNELFNIATSTSNEDLRDLTLDCMPTVYGLYSLGIEMIDTKKTRIEFTEQEREYIQNVKRISKPESKLHQLFQNKNATGRKVLSFQTETELTDFEKQLSNIGILLDGTNGVFGLKSKIKVYNPKETIYVRGNNGNIYTLEEHPERTLDLSPRYNYGIVAIPSLMRMDGVSEQKVLETESIFKSFELEHKPKEVNKPFKTFCFNKLNIEK